MWSFIADHFSTLVAFVGGAGLRHFLPVIWAKVKGETATVEADIKSKL